MPPPPAAKQVMSVSKLGWMEKTGQQSQHHKRLMPLCEGDRASYYLSLTKNHQQCRPNCRVTFPVFERHLTGFMWSPLIFFNVDNVFIISKTLRSNSVYAKSNTCLPDVTKYGNLQRLTYNIQRNPHPHPQGIHSPRVHNQGSRLLLYQVLMPYRFKDPSLSGPPIHPIYSAYLWHSVLIKTLSCMRMILPFSFPSLSLCLSYFTLFPKNVLSSPVHSPHTITTSPHHFPLYLWGKYL